MSYPAYHQRQTAADPGVLSPCHSPARLRAIAHLYGVETVPLEQAHVLAIGCGDGAGLLPFALAYPQAQAVGIDACATRIAQGAAAARRLGAVNLRLQAGDAASLDAAEWGRFDYLIVTGLYSTLSADAGQALLQACTRLLSPRGVLYLDSHVYPGAKALEVVRDALLLHAHAAQNNAEQRQSARAALTLFKQGMAAANPQSAPLAAAAAQFERALDAGANPLACTPRYFVELADAAAQAGLAYLGDTQPLSEIPSTFGLDVALNHSLLALGQPSATVRQQYLDFATGRAFRQSLWLAQARAGQALSQPDLSRLRDLRFAAGLIRHANNDPGQGVDYTNVAYINHLNRGLITRDADLVTVVDTLAHAWPASIPYDTLLAVLMHKHQTDAAASKTLEHALQTLMEHDLVHYCLGRGPYESKPEPKTKSKTNTLLRLPAFLTEPTPPAGDAALPRFNLWHETVDYLPPPAQAAILSRLVTGQLLSEAVADATPDSSEVGDTLRQLKRHGLAWTDTQAWTDLLRRTLDATKGLLPLMNLYVSALATLSLNADVMSQSGHQPNPAPAIAAQIKHMNEAIMRQDYVTAESIAQNLTSVAPHCWDAWNCLAVCLHDTGRSAQALHAALVMLNLAPADVQSHIVLAGVLTALKRCGEAVSAGRRAIELDPRNAEAHALLANALSDLQRYHEAQASYRNAIALDPKHRKSHVNLYLTYVENGEVTLAEQAAREVIATFPVDVNIHSHLLFVLNYAVEHTAEEIFLAYQEYDRQLFQPLRSHWRPHQNPRHANRKLKIGYVSPDFRKHASNHFVEPVLAHHDRQAFELTAYAQLQSKDEDDVTKRFKTYFDHWTPTAGLTDAQLADKIRADRIDLLIDLAGHTTGNRLGAFALKPAPVSLTWMGYGYTTGLSAIDYIILDETTAPPGSEALFAERVWRMQTFCAYRPGDSMGEVNELPALSAQAITFGTLSRSLRINHRVIRTWAAILRRLPNARLVVDSSNYINATQCETLIARFEAQGIGRDRLVIGYHSPPWDVIRQIDIGLDCFPHNSGTTLIESLYMGVPYVSLADRPSVGRLGGSILKAVGLAELICTTEEDYVEKAVALASDLPALAQLRQTLRQRLRDSPLMDEAGFTRAFETAFKQMYAQWCEAQT